MVRPRVTHLASFVQAALGSEPLRLALIAAALVLVLGSAAVLLHPGDPSGPSVQVAAVARPAHARLPRPRPDEPAVTGSIRPAAPAEPEAAGPGLLVPVHVPAEIQRLDALRTSAMLIAGSRPGCTGGVRSEVLTPDGPGGGSGDGPVVVRVQCGSGLRVYLDEADLGLALLPAAGPEPARLADRDAVAACEAKLRHGLPVPSSFNRLAASTGVYRAPGDDAVVTFDFEAQNGLGFPLAMQAHCLFDAREIARLEVNPR